MLTEDQAARLRDAAAYLENRETRRGVLLAQILEEDAWLLSRLAREDR